MLGNLHVRFGVGVRVKLPSLHHCTTSGRNGADIDGRQKNDFALVLGIAVTINTIHSFFAIWSKLRNCFDLPKSNRMVQCFVSVSLDPPREKYSCRCSDCLCKSPLLRL